MAGLFAPTVVDDDTVFDGRVVVEPGENFRAAPFAGGEIPLAIAEDDVGLVASYQVFELRDHVLVDVAWFVGEPERVVPLVERKIIAHLEAFVADRSREIAEDVAPGAGLDGVPGTAPGCAGFFAGPQSEALVMLGSEGYVFGTRAGEDVGPMIGIEEFGAKLRGEILVVKVGSVSLLMVGPGARFNGFGAAFFAVGHRVPIPFGIGEFARNDWRVRRDGVDAPVDEDAEFGFVKPGRIGTLVDGIPSGLIGLGKQGGGEQKSMHRYCHNKRI